MKKQMMKHCMIWLGKRTPIIGYDVNEQDSVRRRYIALGPCQPKQHDFPTRDIGGNRYFMAHWFDKYKWLEYSVELDTAFCFVCYLFKDKIKFHGGDNFVKGGFRNWNMMTNRLNKHVGSITSAHCEAQEKYDLFITPSASIEESIASSFKLAKTLYISRLTHSIECLRFLLSQGLAFRGHDERECSLNKGNFLEILNWLARNSEKVNKVVLNNAPKNCKMTCHDIQLELINCCAKETTSLLLKDLGQEHFAILANESSDVYQREELAVCLRYVDKTGMVVERFLGIMHVISLYASIRLVLKRIGNGKEYSSAEAIGAQTMLTSFESFEFVFMLHLLQELFGYTDDLSIALQKRDQDIVNAIALISLTKEQLQNLLEDDGWRYFLKNVTSFCLKHKIKVPDMDGFYKPVQRSPKFFKKAKNLHRFHVDMFLGLIDRQLQELNDKFDEVNIEVLICMASFNPLDSFTAYDKDKLVKLAHFYPKDFSDIELLKLPYQLSMFVADLRRDERFRKVKNIAQLSVMLVETKKSLQYDIVYKLLKLVLILPVVTAVLRGSFLR